MAYGYFIVRFSRFDQLVKKSFCWRFFPVNSLWLMIQVPSFAEPPPFACSLLIFLGYKLHWHHTFILHTYFHTNVGIVCIGSHGWWRCVCWWKAHANNSLYLLNTPHCPSAPLFVIAHSREGSLRWSHQSSVLSCLTLSRALSSGSDGSLGKCLSVCTCSIEENWKN
jgi:hypothetical protein